MMFFHEFFILFALAPFVLIPIEKVLPYPFLVEEIVKFIIILGLANKKFKTHLLAPVLGGFLFALTETFLYLPNIIVNGDPVVIFKRLLITGTMHVITTFLMYLGFRKKLIFGLMALGLSILIHYFFNKYCILIRI